MSDNTRPGTAVVTGASTGLGADYARRLAERGHDLVLIARTKERLDKLAAEITGSTGRKVEVVVADLTDTRQLQQVEDKLRGDDTIDVLVNNAGGSLFGPLNGADPAALENLVTLNVTSLTRLTTAVVGGLVARGHGTIVNISSALALNIMPVSATYSATKAYVLAFTQSLHQELAETGVRVQAVLPGALSTEFWDGSGIELSAFPDEWVMTSADAADAALAGLDKGEPVTILSLPELGEWEDYEAGRQKLIPNLSLSTPAPRYTT
ncbi:SDR family oxidoreductase [Amycolatopsis carbonis]|uniref:NADP-dependent 3-hydroxy acid dehydrogenase YdfG n=1 Tax=Amycolatopsis carbonis TaxID=715471 RepID=A0A9Y2N193_9PSEU|nr:SDR family oxidoreductase [Amycolatopsis sp. 2-15]WIX82824.1 SDR family oxidoreductase [Amycolatopsis sp. 2-15]